MKITFTSLEAAQSYRAFAEGAESVSREMAAMTLKRADAYAAVIALVKAGETDAEGPLTIIIPDDLAKMAGDVLEDCLDTGEPVLWPDDFTVGG